MHETARGGTVVTGGSRGPNGGQGGYVYSGPRGGVSVGGGKGGSVTGPGGPEVSAGKSGRVTMGPNGNVHAGGSKGAAVTGPGGKTIAGGAHAGASVGPRGSTAHGSRAGAATGPGGTVAGGSRAGVATGPGGTVAGGSRGAVAVGPNGAVAGGGRYAAGSGAYGSGAAGTRFVGAADLQAQGATVRDSFSHHDSFTPDWYAEHPGAWAAAGLAAGSLWNAGSWNDYSSYYGYSEETSPVSYNYGDNVTYQDGNVYYDDEPYATAEEYAEQATTIAEAGTVEPAAEEEWLPLGVFAMVKGEESTSNDIFQLALNKSGTLRGNYYNAISDTTTPIEGAIDTKSQRVAWLIEGKKEPIYETGLYNLTQDESTMLVHFGKERTEQYRLFRMQEPEEGSAEASAAAPAE